MPTDVAWQHFRTVFTVLIGGFALIMGILRSDPALMTVGGGLIGFAPAAKGP
jgi:hypothetical protein